MEINLLAIIFEAFAVVAYFAIYYRRSSQTDLVLLLGMPFFALALMIGIAASHKDYSLVLLLIFPEILIGMAPSFAIRRSQNNGIRCKNSLTERKHKSQRR